MSSAGQWYRIDLGDGTVETVNGVNVLRAAQGAFNKPNQVIATCRFRTTFAIYSTGDKLTQGEEEMLAVRDAWEEGNHERAKAYGRG